jgi:hypothetical protein
LFSGLAGFEIIYVANLSSVPSDIAMSVFLRHFASDDRFNLHRWRVGPFASSVPFILGTLSRLKTLLPALIAGLSRLPARKPFEASQIEPPWWSRIDQSQASDCAKCRESPKFRHFVAAAVPA